MTEIYQATLSLLFIVFFLVVALSKATPFYWLSLFFACLEAAMRQLWVTIRLAAIFYWRGYPLTLAHVRAEIARKSEV